MSWFIALGKVTLWFMGIAFVVAGAIFLVLPAFITTIFEIVVPTTTALVEVRGVYGGMSVGVGVMLIVAALRQDWLRPGLFALAAMMGGLVVGRTAGLIIDGPTNLYEYSQLGTEAVALALSVFTLWGLNRAKSQKDK